MSIKLEVEKAFDRLELKSVESALESLGSMIK